MKLIEALELGEECGLMTVGEALLNIDLHASSIFRYDEIRSGIESLWVEYYTRLKTRGFNLDSPVLEAIKVLRENEEGGD